MRWVPTSWHRFLAESTCGSAICFAWLGNWNPVVVCFAFGLRTFFGAPLSRRRIFILMIRCDCLRDLGMSLDDYMLTALSAMKRPVTDSWSLVRVMYYSTYNIYQLLFGISCYFISGLTLPRQELLLPSDYWAVKEDCRRRERARILASEKYLGLSLSWK